MEEEDGHEIMTIEWMRGKPAPEAVIALPACHCCTACKKDKCPCLDNGMKCTQICMLKTYDNQGKDKEEDSSVRDECEDCDNDSEDK